MKILTKKNVIIIASVGVLVLLVVSGVFLGQSVFKDDSVDEKPTSNTKHERTSSDSQPAPVDKLPELPKGALGKTACDIFKQSIADKYVGTSAEKETPPAQPGQEAGITTCVYKKDATEAKLVVHRYQTEAKAKEYLESLQDSAEAVSQKKEFIVAVDMTQGESGLTETAERILDEVLKQL